MEKLFKLFFVQLDCIVESSNTVMSCYFTPTGGTVYSNAFTMAFDLLKGTSAGRGSSRKKVIIFLTDGQPNDAAYLIMETIKTKNAELNNSVVIMTYGMLPNLQILRDIAEQDGTKYGVPKAPDVIVSTPVKSCFSII